MKYNYTYHLFHLTLYLTTPFLLLYINWTAYASIIDSGLVTIFFILAVVRLTATKKMIKKLDFFNLLFVVLAWASFTFLAPTYTYSEAKHHVIQHVDLEVIFLDTTERTIPTSKKDWWLKADADYSFLVHLNGEKKAFAVKPTTGEVVPIPLRLLIRS